MFAQDSGTTVRADYARCEKVQGRVSGEQR